MSPAVILVAAMCVLLCAVLPHHRRNLLTVAFCGLLLGWRGLQVAPEIRIFPSELFVWVAFLLCLLERNPHPVGKGRDYLWALSLFIFSLAGVINAMNRGHFTDEGIVEAKTFMVFLPALVVFRRWLPSRHETDRYERQFTLVGIAIAGLGVMERTFPRVATLAPSLFTHPIQTRLNFGTSGAVQLAGFSFWGGPIVAVILVPALSMAVSRAFIADGSMKKFWRLGTVVLAAGIFASGYRSAWLGSIVVLAVWLAMGRGSVKMAIVVFSIALLLVIPSEFADRFRTLFLLERSGDTSLVMRANAVREGLESVRGNPLLGTGWGSPIAFNDWLFTAEALGLPGLVVFAGWYAGTFRRVFRVATSANPSVRTIAIGYLAGLAGLAVTMVSGAFTQVAPLTTSFWMFFLLAGRFAELSMLRARPYVFSRLPVAHRNTPGISNLTARQGT